MSLAVGPTVRHKGLLLAGVADLGTAAGSWDNGCNRIDSRSHAMNEPVIVGYARTPIGKFSGGLSSMTAMDLGGVAIKGALERSGVPGDAVENVIMGHVLQAG